MSPVEENLLAHRVVRASRVRSWNVAFHSATPKSGFQVQDLFEGITSFGIFRQCPLWIPRATRVHSSLGNCNRNPRHWYAFSNDIISPFWTSTSHWSWVVQLLFHYYQPKLPGIFFNKSIGRIRDDPTQPFFLGFPLMQILHWPGLLRKPWLRSLPMARSGWDQEHNLDVVFFTLQSFGAVRNMYINAYM